MDRESIENILGRQKVLKNGSMGRRICWESTEEKPRNLEILSRSYQGCKKEVFQGSKTQRDECNKQATQTKIQPTC